MAETTSFTGLGEEFPRTAEQLAELAAAGAAATRKLLGFIDRSPTPYHAAENIAAQLRDNGFEQLAERDAWTLAPGQRGFVLRGGTTVVAFVVGASSPAVSGFRIVGAHTDSPALRVKPQPVRRQHGYQQLGVEIYGAPLLSTWLDRDLSLAGQLACRDERGGLRELLVDFRQPVARVCSLAYHLDRKVNSDGLVLNPQKHMVPVVGLEGEMDLRRRLAALAGCAPEAVVDFDLRLYDTHKGTLGGLDDELVFSARLDNLVSCHAATEALCDAPEGMQSTAVIALYDHEECGSRSAVGAAGTALRDVLNRIALAYPEGQMQAFPRAMAASLLVSADMAHAVHPNYPDKHDEEHMPRLNRGMVIKTNANQSYATSSRTSALFAELCRAVRYAPQHYVARGDMACGSTIGPMAAASLGVQTVDVGAPMLAMHSCRELCGTIDVHLAIETFRQLFR
ncbi:MAG: M18 family aminopeptidase [Deltaproteobacteria bacterium]|nr:M18 family aminopeptidase [Deltaproteobacteria bacterium]